jgi:putative membrane protein
VDVVVEFLTRPPVAVVTFTAIVVGTLAVPAVQAQNSSGVLRGAFDGLLFIAGLVLWAPVLGNVPGVRRTSAVAKAAYLVVQSVLPNFPAVVFIFARHPLYSAFLHAHRAIGLSALGDQQLAGVVAKVGTLPVLWTAAYRALARAQRSEERGLDEEPLYWSDVERAIERSERTERRLGQTS